MDVARRERAALTEEEEKDAAAIVAYEQRYGTFQWNHFSCKRLFYRTGRWPDARRLERLRDYLGIAREAV
jgi:hypothetical protein